MQFRLPNHMNEWVKIYRNIKTSIKVKLKSKYKQYYIKLIKIDTDVDCRKIENNETVANNVLRPSKRENSFMHERALCYLMYEKAKGVPWRGIRAVIQQPSLSTILEEESDGYSEFVSWNSIVSKQCVHSSYLRRYGIRRWLCLRRKSVKIISM